jgi:hypothetical protein
MNLGRFQCIFTLLALPVFAADPAAKVPPPTSQGTVNASGKFTPANFATAISTNGNVPRTPAEAEAELNRALSFKQTGSNTFQIGRVEFDREKRTVTVPATVCVTNQILEYALVTTGGKTYESLLATAASPVDIHLALLLLGVSQVPILGDVKQPAPIPDTNALQIDVSWQTNGQVITVPLSKLIVFTDGHPESLGLPMSLDKWLYNGSQFDQWGFEAQREGSLVALIRDPAALVNNPGSDRDNDLVHFPNARILPEQGTPVSVILRLPVVAPPPPPAPLPGVTPITPLSTNRF